MTAGIRSLSQGQSFWNGAWKGAIVGAAGGGLGVIGGERNKLLHKANDKEIKNFFEEYDHKLNKHHFTIKRGFIVKL